MPTGSVAARHRSARRRHRRGGDHGHLDLLERGFDGLAGDAAVGDRLGALPGRLALVLGYQRLDLVVREQQGDEHCLVTRGFAFGQQHAAQPRAQVVLIRAVDLRIARLVEQAQQLALLLAQYAALDEPVGEPAGEGLELLGQPPDPVLGVARLVRRGDRGVRLGQQRMRRRAFRGHELAVRLADRAGGGEIEQQRAGQARVAARGRGVLAALVVEQEQQELLGEDQFHLGGLPGRTRPHAEDEAVLRAERRRLADLQPLAGNQLESPARQDPRGDGLDLELAEAHPEALPRAAAERYVGALRERRAALRARSARAGTPPGPPTRRAGGGEA